MACILGNTLIAITSATSPGVTGKDTLTMASIFCSRNKQIYSFKEAATNKTLLK